MRQPVDLQEEHAWYIRLDDPEPPGRDPSVMEIDLVVVHRQQTDQGRVDGGHGQGQQDALEESGDLHVADHLRRQPDHRAVDDQGGAAE